MNLLPLPILIPLLTAIVLLLAWGRLKLQRLLSVTGAVALVVAALVLLLTVWRQGIQAVQMGDWPAPFGITLVADLLSAVLVTLTALMGLAVAVYSLGSIDREREHYGYYPLLHVLLMGVCGAFLTGDMFNLYVWFEVMLMASFVLLTLGGLRAQLEGGIKYVTLNLLSSALFLAAVGMLYGLTGTLNMAHLARELPQVANSGLVTTLALLFLVAFGIKAAAFPLFFWLPASYHTAPVSVSAIFAGLLTKVGVYALIRVFTLLFVQDVGYTHTIILTIAGLTMLTGVLGAIAQTELRRLLSFQIVSHIGFMLMGLALFTPLALAGAVFYLLHDIIVKTNLFLVSGVIYKLRGTYQFKKLGGLYLAYPGLAVLFLISAFSLAGIPPLSGFWAKLALIRAGLEVEQYLIVITALVASLLTLFSMTKIWDEVFWKANPQSANVPPQAPGLRQMALLMVPIIILAVFTVTIGLWAEPIFILSTRAAEQLLDPTAYINTVLGGTR
ncbi:Na+/H+ antiporter subunit D [Chloroflexota bacterium]